MLTSLLCVCLCKALAVLVETERAVGSWLTLLTPPWLSKFVIEVSCKTGKGRLGGGGVDPRMSPRSSQLPETQPSPSSPLDIGPACSQFGVRMHLLGTSCTIALPSATIQVFPSLSILAYRIHIGGFHPAELAYQAIITSMQDKRRAKLGRFGFPTRKIRPTHGKNRPAKALLTNCLFVCTVAPTLDRPVTM